MVAKEEIILDALEIQKRLLDKGEHAEEEVICELLESLDSEFEGNKIEHIVNMIIGNQEDESTIYEDQAGPSRLEVTCLKPKPQSSPMNYKTCNDTNHLSSESDDDRDFYYSNNYSDSLIEVIAEDEDISSSSAVSLVSFMPVSPLSSSHQDKATNNNKTETANNNNLNEVEMEENNNDVVCLTSADEIERKTESPKPGCSKDLIDDTSSNADEFCNTCNIEDLQKDAKQLHNILPRYDYSLIYETLLKNQNELNRIELTLWDLLPRERPVIRILHKEKAPDKPVCGSNNETKVVAEDTVGEVHVTEKVLRSKISEESSNIIMLEKAYNKLRERNTTVKRLLQDQGLDATKMQKKIKCTNNSPSNSPVIVKPSDVHASKVLRPAKLTFENNILPTPVAVSSPLQKQHKPKAFKINAMHPQPLFPPTKRSVTPSPPSSPVLRLPSLAPSFLPPPPVQSKPKLASSPDGKLKQQILSPPKLRLEKQPAIVLGSPASNVKPFVMNFEEPLFRACQNMLHHFANKHSAAATASNKTACEKNEETKEVKSIENPAQLPRKEPTKGGIEIATIDGMVVTAPIRTKDMPILNTSNGKNEVNRVESNVNPETQISNPTKEVAHQEQSKQKVENVATTSKESNVAVLTQRACKIYYKLIPMFPTVSTEYIKQLCQKSVRDDVPSDTAILQWLAEHLLDRGKDHPNVKKIEPEITVKTTYDLNEQYANLLGIFPEADPGFLRLKAEQLYNYPEKMKEFVQTQLENPDYPTRQESQARKKITDQVKQYTTDFQVERFLEIFPDPFTHFEDVKRECQFNPHGTDFLKNHFSKIRVHTLLNIYTQNKNNLSLTAKTLENLSSDMKSRRCVTQKYIVTQDIPLLQECAFIQHKEEIRIHLARLKEQEEKEFNELKEKNELLECQCCFDNECMPSKCSTCEEGHVFCNTCIIRSTDVILADGKTHVNCLINCGSEFPLAVLQRVLEPTKFSILLCKRQEAEVMAAGLEGLVSCPFCHFASIPPPEDRVFKCLNPDCMKESCRLCKEASHIPLKCDEVKTTDAARLYLEEKMTAALVRKCWSCGRTFFKEDGCNKMSCVCGAQMCYICDKPVKDYKHFEGQGGGGGGKLCPLWSDDRRLNAESVIKVCNETLKHIKEKNPKVDINVAALLPKLPPKSKGPHEEIVHADVLPEHANRIVREIP